MAVKTICKALGSKASMHTYHSILAEQHHHLRK